MKITRVRVRITEEDKVMAYVDVVFEEMFVVKNVRLLKNEGRVFIAMPSIFIKKTGEWKDVAHPITSQFRRDIETAVIDEYNKQCPVTM